MFASEIGNDGMGFEPGFRVDDRLRDERRTGQVELGPGGPETFGARGWPGATGARRKARCHRYRSLVDSTPLGQHRLKKIWIDPDEGSCSKSSSQLNQKQ